MAAQHYKEYAQRMEKHVMDFQQDAPSSNRKSMANPLAKKGALIRGGTHVRGISFKTILLRAALN